MLLIKADKDSAVIAPIFIVSLKFISAVHFQGAPEV